MIKTRLFKTVIAILILFSLLANSFSNVEVFSRYDTLLSVNSDSSIEVNKSLSLKNVYDVGIVPGQIEFKIGKGIDGSIANIEVVDVVAVDRFGTEIKTQVRETKDFSVIILDVYYPLLPGFEYDFDLYYKLAYQPGGLFFKSLQIPLRESTIPIEQGLFNVQLPSNYHFTYLDTEGKEAEINDNFATWEIKDNFPKSVSFEYSYIPVRISDYKGSYVFWITINLILLIFLVYEVRKEIQRIRAEENEA